MSSPTKKSRFVPIALILATTLLVLFVLWKLGALLLFLGLLAAVANLTTESLHLDPRIGFVVVALLFTGLWYLVIYSRRIGRLRYLLLGVALAALSVAAFSFGDPKLRRLASTDYPCFGVFGEPRCYVPDGSGPSLETPLYQVSSGYRILRGEEVFDEAGRKLRAATRADLARFRLAPQRVFSLQTGDCFSSAGEPRCLYRIIELTDDKGYALYRTAVLIDAEALQHPIYDREGRELKVLSLEAADAVREWEIRDPVGPLRLSSQ